MEKPHKTPNQLAGQSSPYLLQHLYNPVNWHPWGSTALERARKENKPLLVSIGYSACHWCHVMEHESFEDQEVARLMNEYFVCVKVDREERPDIDHLYMNAVQLLSGQGGWPLNCFALPDGRPFWGATYFPKQQWMDILARIAELYATRNEQLVLQANEITQGVAQSSYIEPEIDAPAFSQPQAQAMASNMLKSMDTREGGSLGAPKFPMPGTYEFLLHYYKHTGDEKSLDQVLLTLNKMAMGGIYDQVGGGFARYSTDEAWKVPHFEKMLYDNAQLVSLYSLAYKAKNEPLLKQVVFETIAFVSRDLTSPHGVFYSALDADSEGQEGIYYVWSEKDLNDILGTDAALVKKFYQVGGKGYWEKGQNILLRNQTNEQFAVQQGLDPLKWEQAIGRAKDKLLEARGKRIAPGLDNKVLVGWNALMIRALSDAYAAFGEERFLQQAIKAADFILHYAMEPSGKLYRSLNGKVPAIDGFLEDYALMIRALISLYEVSMNPGYLVNASVLTERVLKEFGSEQTNLFLFSSKESEPLAAAFYEFHDGVIPSSNSVMACNLYYLAQYYENPQWERHSRMMLGDMKKHLVQYSSSYSNWGTLLVQQVYPFYTLAICGKQAREVLPPIYQGFLPHVLLAPAISAREDVPLLRGRYREGETWFYLCRMGSCQLPVRTFEEVQQQMKATTGDIY